MKTLLVYYTRTGTTKVVAEAIQQKLNCDIEEIIDKKDRSGPVGYMLAGKDIMQKNDTVIDEPKYNPGDYDLVIIGTPVWVGLPAVAIRTYLNRFASSIKETAVFTTQGGKNRQRVFDDISNLLNKNLKSEKFFLTKDVKQGNYSQGLDEFIETIS